MSGSARLIAGKGDRAVLTFTDDAPESDWRTHIVLTFVDGEITAMQEHRREAKAYRLAGV